MFRHVLFVLLGLFLSLVGFPAYADWKAEREQLGKLYVAGPFRVFYSETGKNALNERNRADNNANGTPDFIERVGDKLMYARRVYIESFGFTDPLASERFKGQVQYIDVHFLRLAGQGTSGDGIHHLKYRTLPGKDAGSLIITLTADLAPDSITPEHELFHTFQYGYTSIKNAWLSEGTARWSEYVFMPGTGEVKVLPRQMKKLEDALNMSYGAQFLWRRIAQLCDSNNGEFSPPDGMDATRLSELYNNSDFTIHGYKLMRSLYENLGSVEKAISQQRGYPLFNWHEAEKNSPLNDKVILAALKQSISHNSCRQGVEVKAFLKVVDAYLSGLAVQRAKDVSDLLQELGNPYAARYVSGPDIYARNIWTMHLYDDAIYFGAGNAANDGPSPNAGPVPIIRYEPKMKRFVTEGSVDEEQIDLYREIDGQLVIPGSDARESTRLGNYYSRNPEGKWRKFRNLPEALHTFDIVFHQGQLFAAIGTTKGAAVAISSDKGVSWKLVYLGEKQRVYNLLEIDGILYASKQLLPKGKLKELSEPEQAGYFSIAEFRDGEFVPRPDLRMRDLFPGMPLKESKTTRLSRNVASGGRVAYIGAYYYNNPFGVFVASSFKEGGVEVRRIELPTVYKPVDLIVRGSKLYILCNREEETGFKNAVMEASLDDPTAAREIFNFTSPALARSFEIFGGDFYFGMGSDLKSQRNWKVEDISEETGKVLMLAKKYVE